MQVDLRRRCTLHMARGLAEQVVKTVKGMESPGHDERALRHVARFVYDAIGSALEKESTHSDRYEKLRHFVTGLTLLEDKSQAVQFAIAFTILMEDLAGPEGGWKPDTERVMSVAKRSRLDLAKGYANQLAASPNPIPYKPTDHLLKGLGRMVADYVTCILEEQVLHSAVVADVVDLLDEAVARCDTSTLVKFGYCLVVFMEGFTAPDQDTNAVKPPSEDVPSEEKINEDDETEVKEASKIRAESTEGEGGEENESAVKTPSEDVPSEEKIKEEDETEVNEASKMRVESAEGGEENEPAVKTPSEDVPSEEKIKEEDETEVREDSKIRVESPEGEEENEPAVKTPTVDDHKEEMEEKEQEDETEVKEESMIRVEFMEDEENNEIAARTLSGGDQEEEIEEKKEGEKKEEEDESEVKEESKRSEESIEGGEEIAIDEEDESEVRRRGTKRRAASVGEDQENVETKAEDAVTPKRRGRPRTKSLEPVEFGPKRRQGRPSGPYGSYKKTRKEEEKVKMEEVDPTAKRSRGRPRGSVNRAKSEEKEVEEEEENDALEDTVDEDPVDLVDENGFPYWYLL